MEAICHFSLENVVPITHEQNICSKTFLDCTAHEQTIVCRQLFAGHVVGSRPMERKKKMHGMIIIIISVLFLPLEFMSSGMVEHIWIAGAYKWAPEALTCRWSGDIFIIGPLQDPVTWYGINYTGTQMTQWDFQNKGKSGWTGKSSFVFEVPLRYLRPSVSCSVPCDRILQRAYHYFILYLNNTIVYRFYPQKNLHRLCFRFPLGHLRVPGGIANNDYAKFWGVKEVY